MFLHDLFDLLFTSSLQLLLSQQMKSKENFLMETIKHAQYETLSYCMFLYLHHLMYILGY